MSFDQQFIIDALKSFLEQRGVDDSLVDLTCDNLTWLAHSGPVRLYEEPTVGTTTEEPSVEKVHEEEQVEEQVEGKADLPYFICYTQKRKMRRLHRRGGCGNWPGFNIHDYTEFESLVGVEFDDYCHLCWSKGSKPNLSAIQKIMKGDVPGTVSDSTGSSGDSSSVSSIAE
jgi:hypothetical protein